MAAKTTQIALWYNPVAKTHEAMIVGRGRPIREDVSAEIRAKSKRTIFSGKKEEVLATLAKTTKMTPAEVKAAILKDSSVTYKGERENPYTKKAETVTA